LGFVALQAKENAKEARDWIDRWRSEQQAADSGSSGSNGSSVQAVKAETVKAGSGSQGPAKEWIRDWRAR